MTNRVGDVWLETMWCRRPADIDDLREKRETAMSKDYIIIHVEGSVSRAAFFDGGGWSTEYPDAVKFARKQALLRAEHLASVRDDIGAEHELRVVKEYGTAAERVIAAFPAAPLRRR